MNCKQMENRLIAYLDGKANRTERREMEAHMAACAACRTRAEEFRLLWGALDEMPMTEPSPAFDARMRARLATEPARRSFWAWLAPSPRLAFAASMLLVASVWISSLPQSPRQDAVMPNPDAEFRMIKDLPVLEDYDVLANFEALSELPPQPSAENKDM